MQNTKLITTLTISYYISFVKCQSGCDQYSKIYTDQNIKHLSCLQDRNCKAETLKQDEVLKSINDLRIEFSKAKQAANMLKLIWNDELAALSQFIVCTTLNTYTEIQYGAKSQVLPQKLIMQHKDPPSNIDAMLKEKYKEVENNINENSKDVSDKDVSSLTLAETSDVGCSAVDNAANKKKDATGNPKTGFDYICLTLPKKEATSLWFIKGSPCSKCPNGTLCTQDKYLCSADSQAQQSVLEQVDFWVIGIALIGCGLIIILCGLLMYCRSIHMTKKHYLARGGSHMLGITSPGLIEDENDEADNE